jgi:SAM-dependent methyltransferase
MVATTRRDRHLSVTHIQLLAMLNTLMPESRSVIRICDVGCGGGQFLAFISRELPKLRPNQRFEFYGLDVTDSGVQATGFFQKALATLREADPTVDWSDRLRLTTSTEPWTFDDQSFDVVVSNQVLEHVADHKLFMREQWRTLAEGGLGIHLFPLRETLWEGHIHMPFAHWVRQWAFRERYIKLMSYLFSASYRGHRSVMGMDRDTHAEQHADYIEFMTNYPTTHEVVSAAKATRLRPSFVHSGELYWARLRRLLKKPAKMNYAASSPISSALSLPLWRALGSVTLLTEKRLTYFR